MKSYEPRVFNHVFPRLGDPALDMLQKSVPGIPGQDYPIYASVPETAFTCDGQVDGGELPSPYVELSMVKDIELSMY